VILGLSWGGWHLPLFLIPGIYLTGTGFGTIGITFAQSLVTAVSLSVMFTWVFNHTRASVLIAVMLARRTIVDGRCSRYCCRPRFHSSTSPTGLSCTGRQRWSATGSLRWPLSSSAGRNSAIAATRQALPWMRTNRIRDPADRARQGAADVAPLRRDVGVRRAAGRMRVPQGLRESSGHGPLAAGVRGQLARQGSAGAAAEVGCSTRHRGDGDDTYAAPVAGDHRRPDQSRPHHKVRIGACVGHARMVRSSYEFEGMRTAMTLATL
jgi:hypothetical protein